MHDLTPEQVDKLLILVAEGIKAYQYGNPTRHIEAVIRWIEINAPEYLLNAPDNL